MNTITHMEYANGPQQVPEVATAAADGQRLFPFAGIWQDKGKTSPTTVSQNAGWAWAVKAKNERN